MAKAFATNESIIGYANEILQLEFQSWEEGVRGGMGVGGGILVVCLDCWPLTFVICG